MIPISERRLELAIGTCLGHLHLKPALASALETLPGDGRIILPSAGLPRYGKAVLFRA